jgi:hypothetical protein
MHGLPAPPTGEAGFPPARCESGPPARLARHRGSRHGDRKHLKQPDVDPHIRSRESREGYGPGDPALGHSVIITTSSLSSDDTKSPSLVGHENRRGHGRLSA